MPFLSSDAAAIIDRDNRLAAASTDPGPMSAILNEIMAMIDAGNIGITADAGDVDSLALGGGAFSRDKSSSAGNGTTLSFAWKASRINIGLVNVAVSAGSLTLTNSVANYVEVDRTGTVSSNTSGFTSGRLPLWIITPGVSSYTDNNVVSQKALLALISVVSGAMLSTVAATKEISSQLGASIAATTSFLIQAPNCAATLIRASFISSQAYAGDDSNYWTITLTNKTASGSGTTVLLDGGATNTTRATGGTPIVANVAVALALTGTGGDLVTAANDGLLLTFTKTGTPAAITLGQIRLDFQFSV